MADDDNEGQAPLEERVGRIETTLTQLMQGRGPAKGAHDDAGKLTQDRLAAPTTVEEQVAAALAAKDKQAKEEGLHADVASVKQELAALKEQPPAPPERRVEKIMGWGRV